MIDRRHLLDEIENLVERLGRVLPQRDVVAGILDDELLEIRRVGIERAFRGEGRWVGLKQQVVFAGDFKHRSRYSSRTRGIERELEVQFGTGACTDVRSIPGKDIA